MKFYKITMLFILMMVISSTVKADDAYGLRECVRDGIQNNLEIRKAEYELKKMREMTRGIESQYEPFLNMQVMRNHMDSDIFTMPFPGASVTMGGASDRDSLSLGVRKKTRLGGLLNLSWSAVREEDEYQSILKKYNPNYQSGLSLSYIQPLLRNTIGSNDRRVIKMFKGREGIAELSLRSARNALKNRIVKSYWNLNFAKENLEVQKAMLERTGKLLQSNRRKFRDGLVEEVDIVAAEASIAVLEAGILQAEDGLISAGEGLRKIINLAAEEPVEFSSGYPEGLKHEGLDEQKVIEKALEQSPELEALRKSRELSAIDSSIKRNEKLPGIDMIAQYGLNGMGGSWRSNYESLADMNYPVWYVGFKMDYFPFHRGASSVFRQSRIEERINTVSEEDIKAGIVVRCKSLVRSINTAAKSYKAAARALRLQKKKLKLENEKFNQGRSASQYILIYQNDLGRAETEYYKSMTNYFNLMADLEFITGAQ